MNFFSAIHFSRMAWRFTAAPCASLILAGPSSKHCRSGALTASLSSVFSLKSVWSMNLIVLYAEVPQSCIRKIRPPGGLFSNHSKRNGYKPEEGMVNCPVCFLHTVYQVVIDYSVPFICRIAPSSDSSSKVHTVGWLFFANKLKWPVKRAA